MGAGFVAPNDIMSAEGGMPAHATPGFVSVEGYLHTPYQPDCDYEDGLVTQRNLGELPHSWLQTLLSAYILRRRKGWNVTPLVEQRVQIGPRKFSIPDTCVLRGPKPEQRISARHP